MVIAGHNSSTLARVNAMVQRIDLICKVLAPLIVGVVYEFACPMVAAVSIASWHVLSCIVEYVFLQKVYTANPALAIKPARKPEALKGATDAGNDDADAEKGTDAVAGAAANGGCCAGVKAAFERGCSGWACYLRQPTLLAGISLALLYVVAGESEREGAVHFPTSHLPPPNLSCLVELK